MQPDMLPMAWHALMLLSEPRRLLVLLIGVLIGLAIGVLPGLNGIIGIALLIPFTYDMDPHTAIALLLGMAAVITSADFITAVLFGVPGHVGAAATVMDGHALARRGEAGRAFGAGFAASLAGGVIGAVVLAASIPVLRPVMLSIGSPELLAFTLFGLGMVAVLSGQAPLQGLTAAGLGLMVSMIGSRSESGTLRWTFDTLYLYDGVPLVPATLGLFAMPELCELAITGRTIAGDHTAALNLSNQWHGVRDVVRHWWLVFRCGLLGTALGAVPGIGSAVIDWIAYGYAQRTEKNAETFGHGDIRGVIAPESSNNAKEGGHLVPTIAFGVPAGASMTILLGAFVMHGLTPGPEMLTKHLDVTYTIIWSLTLAHVIGALICLMSSRWLARVSMIPVSILLPIVISVVFIAAYEGSHSIGDLFCLMIFGIVGWIMKRLEWPRPPMVLGIVIGGTFERYLYISTSLYGAAWMLRPVVIGTLALVGWILFRPLLCIFQTVAGQLRRIGSYRIHFGPSAYFTLAVMVFIVAAIALSLDWPAAAKPVPLAACSIALAAASLSLIAELFGAGPLNMRADGTHHRENSSPATVPHNGGRALSYFAWLGALLTLTILIGLLPAVTLFIIAYMRFGFGEPWLNCVSCAASTAIACWVVFDRLLSVHWPASVAGDLLPVLRSATGFI